MSETADYVGYDQFPMTDPPTLWASIEADLLRARNLLLDEADSGFHVVLSQRFIKQQIADLFYVNVRLLESWDEQIQPSHLPVVQQ